MSSTNQSIPSNFRALVADFTRDLSTAFPEWSHMWDKWGDEDTTDDQLETLFTFCSKIYPVRFFDILYQNEDIFKEDCTEDVYFFPNMSFKLIFNSEGLSDNSKKIIWKYLQLMLFTVVGSANDSSNFGDTAKLFEGIDENELQEKLNETMENLTGFFSKMPTSSDEQTGADLPDGQSFENIFKNMPNMEGMPDLSNLQNTLKTLFEGKIGTLAKEMAEEIADEFKDVLGDVGDTNVNPQDVLKKLMKNPAKISGLMKKVSAKLDEKMKNGSISKDEIMREAGDMMNKMKEMGGSENFKEMFQNMAKSMGGLGKNMKFNQGAFDRMVKKEDNKSKVLDRATQRRQQLQKDKQAEFEKMMQRKREQLALQQQYSLTQTADPNRMVFKINGEEEQEKSFIHPDLEKMLEAEDKAKVSVENEKKVNKNKKNKKSKK